MEKINTQVAAEAAKKICEPLRLASEQKKKEIGECVKDMIIKGTPDEVTKVYKKHPEYFKSTNSISIQGNGFNYYNVKWQGEIPLVSTYNYEISSSNSTILHKMVSQHEDMVKKHKETMQDIENTILALGTHKRVEEQFPEASPYVGNGQNSNTAVMLNLAPIRQVACALIPGCKQEPKQEVKKTAKK